MMETIRLSEISSQATAALTAFDAAGLERLASQLGEVALSQSTGLPVIEPETAATVAASQRIFHEVLTATEQSIQLLQRLQDRKVRAEWAR